MSLAWLAPLLVSGAFLPDGMSAASKDAPKKKPEIKMQRSSPSSGVVHEDQGPNMDRSRAKPGRELKPTSGPKVQKKDSRSDVIRPKVQGDGTVSTTPNRGKDNRLNQPDLVLQPGPEIRGSSFTPDAGIGGTTGKVFAPGGVVYLLGFHFGDQQGTVHLEVDGSLFPEHGHTIPLQVTKWRNDLVGAKIPKPMTGPLGKTAVRIHLVSADGRKSTYDGDFDVPVEKRVLKPYDPAVRLVSCAQGPNDNNCGHPSDGTLWGKHEKDGGIDVVPSNGGDRWAIHLEDGWVFSKKTQELRITGDDGDTLTVPDLPFGQTSWTPYIRFRVTADDSVQYKVNVEVMRAKGAY